MLEKCHTISGRATPMHDPQQELVVMATLLFHGVLRTVNDIYDL